MKTIKIIDLLNKIANKEEVPKKIKYQNKIFEHWDNGNIQDYWYEGNKSLFDDFIDCSRITDLNYELEIIEEDKKIENLSNLVCGDNLTWEVSVNRSKLNELIDIVNEMKSNV